MATNLSYCLIFFVFSLFISGEQPNIRNFGIEYFRIRFRNCFADFVPTRSIKEETVNITSILRLNSDIVFLRAFIDYVIIELKSINGYFILLFSILK